MNNIQNMTERELLVQLSTELSYLKKSIAEMTDKINKIEDDLSEIKNKFVQKDELKEYVSKSEFEPVRKVVWGVCGIVGLSVLGLLLKLMGLPLPF